MLLMAGCAQMPPSQTRPAVPMAERAAAQAHQGQYAAAAESYRQAANQASEPARSQLLLRSAEAAVRAENGDWAREMLANVQPESLPERDRKRLEMVRLEADIAGRSPSDALDSLPPPEEGMSPEMAARILALRADLLFADGQLANGVAALVQRDVWLLDGQRLRDNDDRIWTQLIARPPDARDLEAAEDPVTRGWLELARLSHRSWPSRESFERALAAWERRHPGHPAARHVLAEKLNFSDSQRAAVGDGGAVGLLLPLSGPLAGAGRAIHDGFMAGYYESSEPRPDVIVYDSSRLTSMQSFLGRARADGLSFLVGPLRKNLVNDLLAAPNGGLGILALNYGDQVNAEFSGVYQFGLSPEDEARAAARRALAEGHDQAIVMVPQGEWGQRVFDAFSEALRAGGGMIYDSATYDPEDKDFSDSIKRILRYGGATSQSRQTDFAFIGARPSAARQIRTQLRYYRASHLPVYATSHAYDGQENVRLNRDLNGLRFSDMPWLLSDSSRVTSRRDRITKIWPESANELPRLIALGLDAWLLTDQLRGGGILAGTRVDGYTGELSVDNYSRVHREPMWAHFVGGKAENLPPVNPAVPDGGRYGTNGGY